MRQILSFKITLKNSSPKIWRRFEIDNTLTFHDLHLVIQLVMGWTNSHLHRFIYEANSYIGIPEYINQEEDEDVIDSRKLMLSEFYDQPEMKIIYQYDFGDYWMHELVLEKIREGVIKFPICFEGEMSCPPEDCGGLSGYYNLLDILKNKKHPEHKECVAWVGDNFHPDEFNIASVNEALKDFKCFDETDED